MRVRRIGYNKIYFLFRMISGFYIFLGVYLYLEVIKVLNYLLSYSFFYLIIFGNVFIDIFWVVLYYYFGIF